jgi:hypothetical protein
MNSTIACITSNGDDPDTRANNRGWIMTIGTHAYDGMPAIPATVCPYELSSIRSLTAYVAQSRNMHERIVEAMVATRFDVSGIAQLRHDDFRHAISFLLDLRNDFSSAR